MAKFEYPEVRMKIARVARIDPERMDVYGDDLSRMVSVRMPVLRVDLLEPTDEEFAVAVDVCRESSEAVETAEPGFAVFGWDSQGRKTHDTRGPILGSSR